MSCKNRLRPGTLVRSPVTDTIYMIVRPEYAKSERYYDSFVATIVRRKSSARIGTIVRLGYGANKWDVVAEVPKHD